MKKEVYQLKLEDIPEARASWGDIWALARTFDGYVYHGGFDTCARIANERLCSTLTELRTCLFFECRRWNHFGYSPHGDDAEYIRGLVTKLRDRVKAGEVE
jgi:hypothetical protein